MKDVVVLGQSVADAVDLGRQLAGLAQLVTQELFGNSVQLANRAFPAAVVGIHCVLDDTYKLAGIVFSARLRQLEAVGITERSPATGVLVKLKDDFLLYYITAGQCQGRGLAQPCGAAQHDDGICRAGDCCGSADAVYCVGFVAHLPCVVDQQKTDVLFIGKGLELPIS